MLTVYERHAKKKLAATITSVIIIAAVVVAADQLKTKGHASANTEIPFATNSDGGTATATPRPTDAPAPSTSIAPAATAVKTPAPTPKPNSSGYRNGTFAASSTYYVPHGSESIKVTLTLNQGLVAGVSIQNSEGGNVSARFQEEFASVYKSYVLGQPIASLRLNAVAGASDTSDGFNTAVSQIAAQARA